jgi:hypothetical protein
MYRDHWRVDRLSQNKRNGGIEFHSASVEMFTTDQGQRMAESQGETIGVLVSDFSEKRLPVLSEGIMHFVDLDMSRLISLEALQDVQYRSKKRAVCERVDRLNTF